MEHNYELTTGRYLFELTKIFFQSVAAHYFHKDHMKLEQLYYHTMDLHERYIEQYCDEEEKEERYREKIYELLDLILLKEQNDTLKMKTSDATYKGIKIRENIINNMYVELWLVDKDLWLYIFESRGHKEEFIYFDIEDPYLLRMDQVYYGLKEKRSPGLLNLLYEKEKGINHKDIAKL